MIPTSPGPFTPFTSGPAPQEHSLPAPLPVPFLSPFPEHRMRYYRLPLRSLFIPPILTPVFTIFLLYLLSLFLRTCPSY